MTDFEAQIPAKLEAFAKKWLSNVDDALKREKNYRKVAKECVNLYEAKTPDQTPFAILYSNTETLMPAVYNATPIPLVDRRFKDPDPIGKAGAEVATRLGKYLISAESEDYDSFDELMQPAVLDTLITNRGLTRFKYVADTSQDQVSNECVYGEAVRWDKFFHGYARTWKKVPWIGFEWDMDREELRANFSEIADQIDLDSQDDATNDDLPTNNREEMTGVKLAKVYEVWDKTTKRVIFLSPSYKLGPLKIVPDPLQLSGFFPMPKPLNFMRKVTTLIPTPLYVQYESQAKELNELTRRLKNIIKACKVRGFYNSTIEGIGKVLEAEDNTLVPVENMESMPEGMAPEKMLWLMPISDLVSAAQTLYQQREQCKQVIYEITGISDILRGASVASETATAQNIKNQWGTLRLKKMQKEVMRYCRDSLRIIIEIAVTRFQQSTVIAMTGLSFPTTEQKQQVQAQMQMQMQQAQMAAQQAARQAALSGQPAPQPAPPPQIPPQIQEMMATPTWEEVLGALKNDIVRSYKVDIETNSTIDAEASQDKQDISELLNALSQFLNGVAPLIEKGVLPFDVAKVMMLAIARRFTFGPQLEDSLNKMVAPPPPSDQPSPADQIKLQAIEAQAKADAAASRAAMVQTQMDGQIAQMEFEQKKALMEQQMQVNQQKLALEQAQLQIALAGTKMKMEQQSAQHEQKMAQIKATPKKEPADG